MLPSNRCCFAPRTVETLPMSEVAFPSSRAVTKTKLNRSQITGFWAAWAGGRWTAWTRSSTRWCWPGAQRVAAQVGHEGDAQPMSAIAGSVLFALFLAGWGSRSSGDRSRTASAGPARSPRPLCVCVVHRRRGVVENVWQLAYSVCCRRRHRRRVGARRNLRGRGVARRSRARWAQAIYRPAITPASFWPPRSTSPSARALAGAPCSGAD